MTDTDREMLIDIYWTLTIFKCVGGFYIGWFLAKWVKKIQNGE